MPALYTYLINMGNRREGFFLRLENTTNQVQDISLFDLARAGVLANSNSTTQNYSWDMTSELAAAATFGHKVLVVIYSNNGAAYQLAQVDNSPNTLDTVTELVTALNTLGLGTFTNVGNIVSVNATAVVFSSITIGTLETSANGAGDAQFSDGGTLIYAPGVTPKMLGTFTQINPAVPFWKNIAANITDGPYNRTRIFTLSSPGSMQSLFFNINSATAKTVHLGFAFTAAAPTLDLQAFVNGAAILNIEGFGDTGPWAAQVNAQLATSYSVSNIRYRCWFVIPFNLVAGQNSIQFVMKTGGSTSYDIGFEVYDNSAAEIAAATGYGDLTLLFSSNDYLGQDFF